MTEIDNRVVDAARRSAEGVLEKASASALLLHSQAILAGRSGGSRYLLLLAGEIQSTFETLAQVSLDRIVQFANTTSAIYRAEYQSIIEDSIPRLIEMFRDNGGHAPSFGRKSESEEAALLTNLLARRDTIMDEFDLSTTPKINGDLLGVQELELAILAVYAKTDKAHKINVLGRPHQPGALESDLGKKFDDQTRATAARAMANLLSRDLLRPTYSDIAHPEEWLAITAAGKAALLSGALDPLDGALMALNPRFISMRRGAREASLAGSEDGWRQAAHSARELLNQVLEALGPDDEVRAQPGFGDAKITRKSRTRVAMRKRPSGSSDSDLDVIETAASLVDALYAKLSGLAHSRNAEGEAKVLIRASDLVLELLLF